MWFRVAIIFHYISSYFLIKYSHSGYEVHHFCPTTEFIQKIARMQLGTTFSVLK